jgi:tRNA(fMet)-specific endonuclease VapC
MTLYMLDTNIISDMVRNPQGKVAQAIAERSADRFCASIITAAELRYGCAKKGSARLEAQVNAILGSLPVYPLDGPADAAYGHIRNTLEAAGTPIGPNDLIIAAHALAIGAVLVTANLNEFARVPGLTLENWV